MIVRILGEGQVDVPDEQVGALNSLDAELERAVESGDELAFRSALAALLDKVRQEAGPVPSDFLGPSELVLPAADASLDEVRDMLGEEGLIPG